ncbi:MAG: hypothetical protein FJZ90_02780 [Chloroflexi bacterium]|nr:hypothetical protein [Chloroflexota bacterium]
MVEVISGGLASLPPNAAAVVGTWVAALLTLATLTFIFENNPVFRIGQYLLVGTASGYAAATAWNSVLWPRLLLLLRDPSAHWVYGLFFLLGLGLVARGLGSASFLGELPLALLFGVGAALALGGAVSGSLLPQIKASLISINPESHGGGLLGWTHAIDALLTVLCTITALSVFHFTVSREGVANALTHGLMGALSRVGRQVIMIVFGALLAGAFLAFFAILKSRLDFLVHDWISLIAHTGF